MKTSVKFTCSTLISTKAIEKSTFSKGIQNSIIFQNHSKLLSGCSSYDCEIPGNVDIALAKPNFT